MRYNFKYYCKDYQNIENYEAAKKDDFVGWHCHHRKGVDIPKEELIALGLYYNRPASELIFLTSREHSRLHNKGKKMSEEFCRKNSESHKGENNPFYGKHHSEEAKKKMMEARKGKHLGKDNSFYGKHHSEEFRKKIGEINKVKMKGMRFFNNGKINIRAKECPEGFVPGRIKKP